MGLKLGITTLTHNKEDIQFVTEFQCFLGHPVSMYLLLVYYNLQFLCKSDLRIPCLYKALEKFSNKSSQKNDGIYVILDQIKVSRVSL